MPTYNQDTLLSGTTSMLASMAAPTTMGSTSAVDATTASSRNARFSLRKKRNFAKTMINDNEEFSPVNISSYNSDFLSGLFADVAKANVLKEFQIEPPSTSTPSDTTRSTTIRSCNRSASSHVISDSSDSPRPLKKSRMNLRPSLYRSRASCMNLLARQQQQQSHNTPFESESTITKPSSPKSIDEIEMPEKKERSSSVFTVQNTNEKTNKKQDSLAFQLDCLETTSTGELSISAIASISPPANTKNKKVVKDVDVAMLAFPNLPSAVSDSSCESNTHAITATGLTRESAPVPHGPAPEIAGAASPSSEERSASKESFGWFIDLDDDETSPVSSSTVTDKKASSDDLAFQAPTTPKRSTNHVEEMEQAYAADTIDSVLGDLF